MHRDSFEPGTMVRSVGVRGIKVWMSMSMGVGVGKPGLLEAAPG